MSAYTLDLRGEPEAAPQTATLAELIGLVRRPVALVRALRAERALPLRVLVDDVPLSGVQAAVVALAAVVRGGGVELGARRYGVVRLVAQAAVAVPAEIVRSRRLYRRAVAVANDGTPPPRRADGARAVLYLRTEPTMRWKGQLVGGASTHTSGVINGFLANDLTVEVLAAERPEWTDGAPFTAVPVRRAFHLVPWLTLAQFGDDVAAGAAGRRADFVYQRYSVGTAAGLDVARRLAVPLVLEYNGSELWIQRHWGQEEEPRFAAPLRLLEERNLRSASLIVVVSAVLKEQLVEAGIAGERVLVNPNGVDVDRVASYRERPPGEWRAQLGLAEAPTIGFVGSFGVWHGVRLLPELVERVARTVPEARWQVIGAGQLFDEVRADFVARGLLDRVDLPGIVAHDEALQRLAACDVCVSPHVPNEDGSRFFGSPTKLFEYMGLAKPIVASDLEQLGEAIEHDRTGLLCPPGDAGAAADAVVRLLGDPELRDRLGRAALASAQRGYSWRAHAGRILDALGAGSGEATH